jgi:hypothetical protein
MQSGEQSSKKIGDFFEDCSPLCILQLLYAYKASGM